VTRLLQCPLRLRGRTHRRRRCDCSPAGASGLGVPKWRPFPGPGADARSLPGQPLQVHQNASAGGPQKSLSRPQPEPRSGPSASASKPTQKVRRRGGGKSAQQGSQREPLFAGRQAAMPSSYGGRRPPVRTFSRFSISPTAEQHVLMSAALDDPEGLLPGGVGGFRSFVHVTEIRCMNGRGVGRVDPAPTPTYCRPSGRVRCRRFL
jgi:hypothetical protein